MNFSEVYNLILESCPFLGGNSYDGIIVKKLAATNTISDTGSSHQSHMAFTGKQKDFFPFLEADGYFNVGYDSKDDDLKKILHTANSVKHLCRKCEFFISRTRFNRI